MAGPVPDAGEQVPCPSCNQQVLLKSMIPIFQNGTKSYVCMACARKLIVHTEAGTEEPAAVT
jgi:DNA-directed RNA polymerase subunit RPC12/RpoP